MTLHRIGLIHTCTLTLKKEVGHDEYGSPLYTDTETQTQCRFITRGTSQGDIKMYDSGPRVSSSISLILPSDVVASEGMIVTSLNTGYQRESGYTITSVQPVYNILTDNVHHFECELEVVE